MRNFLILGKDEVEEEHPLLKNSCLKFNLHLGESLAEWELKLVPSKVLSMENLPLRGFLKCPKWTRMLTGSASKGGMGIYYSYYHCSSSCGVRYKAVEANKLFEEELSKVTVREGMENFYIHSLHEAFKERYDDGQESQRSLLNKIKAQNTRISEARDLLMSGSFSGNDFHAVKFACEKEIRLLESKLPLVSMQAKKVENNLTVRFSNLKSALETYRTQNMEGKRRLISSMYPKIWIMYKSCGLGK